MTVKKVPMRKCIGCMESKPKNELVRIVADDDGNVSIDPVGRAPGRGAYLCRGTQCVGLAIRKNALSRNLKTSVSAQAAEELRRMFEKLQDTNTTGGVTNA